MDKILAIFIISLMVLTFILTFKKGKYKVIIRDSKNEDLENLNRMQTYEFWRNFGKRSRQEEAQRK